MAAKQSKVQEYIQTLAPITAAAATTAFVMYPTQAVS